MARSNAARKRVPGEIVIESSAIRVKLYDATAVGDKGAKPVKIPFVGYTTLDAPVASMPS